MANFISCGLFLFYPLVAIIHIANTNRSATQVLNHAIRKRNQCQKQNMLGICSSTGMSSVKVLKWVLGLV